MLFSSQSFTTVVQHSRGVLVSSCPFKFQEGGNVCKYEAAAIHRVARRGSQSSSSTRSLVNFSAREHEGSLGAVTEGSAGTFKEVPHGSGFRFLIPASASVSLMLLSDPSDLNAPGSSTQTRMDPSAGRLQEDWNVLHGSLFMLLYPPFPSLPGAIATG